MATVYTDEQTLKRALEAGSGYSLTNGILTDNARVHVKTVRWTSTAAPVADIIELFSLPKGARVLRGNIMAGASLGASTTLSVGTDVALTNEAGTALTAAGAANCLAASATSAAFNLPFAATRLLGAQGLTSATTTFRCTIAGATLTAGVELVATIEYAQN